MTEPGPRKSAGELQEIYAELAPKMDRMAWLNRLVTGGHRPRMDASNLEFDDDAFDTVVSSLSTCTFPDPGDVLREMSRVCRPDGRILLQEHGRSSVGALARSQDWRADAHYENHGCRWAQDPLEIVAEAGLPVRRHRMSLLGILTAVEALPG